MRGAVSVLFGMPLFIKLVALPAIGGIIATSAVSLPVDLVSRTVLIGRALKFNRCDVDALSNLGEANAALGRFPQVASAFQKAVACAPSRAEYRFKYGVALYQSKLDGSRELETARRLEPSNPVFTVVRVDKATNTLYLQQ